jgi:hypothetical protein
MAKMDVKWKMRGFKDLRSTPKLVALLEQKGNAVAAASGDGYTVNSSQGRSWPFGRWRVTVGTGSDAAIRDNAANNTLINNLDAGR